MFGRNSIAGGGTALVVALATGALGCGSSGDAAEVSTASKVVPKAQLLKEGSAICAQGNKTINAAFDRFGRKNAAADHIATQAELNAEAAKVVLPVRRMELRRLRALGVPAQDRERFEVMISAMEEGIARGEKDNDLLLANKVRYAFRKASEVGIRFGLVDCWLG